MNDPRFPIGEFCRPADLSESERLTLIAQIETLPDELEKCVFGLSDEMLETPYREGGWKLRQVVHHLADSHINALCRFKLALTESNPVIRPYDEDLWVSLADSSAPLSEAIALLRSIHLKWVAILGSLPADDFSRTLIHPDSGIWTLDQMLALYAWHGRHHLAHIAQARLARGW